MDKQLIILSNGVRVGTATAGRDTVTLTYDNDWLTADEAFPISLSMPLNRRNYGHNIVDPYLWNLLPDNERVLGKWAARFGVSSRNAFALIREVGEDVAGALQFVKPERVDTVLAKSGGTIDWISAGEVGERLADLHRDESAWSRSSDVGFFSLSGAQPKLALLYKDGKWGIPNGRMPTTHILKPPSDQFDGHAENEHFCMTLAGLLGLGVARSTVQNFDGQIAIVVERFDRIARGSGFGRVPMEDICQALGIHPRMKYQNHGGPGVRQIAMLLQQHSSQQDVDVRTFVDALAFNWLIGGTDAHSKNYSLLIGAGGRARLAPLYDIASALGYKSLDPKKMKHAMKIGSHYELKDITERDWRKVGTEIGMDGDSVIARVDAMAKALPDAVVTTQAALKKQGLTHPLVAYMSNRIIAHVKSCVMRITVGR
jgi:serine/threonine-protein kinase HipA